MHRSDTYWHLADRGQALAIGTAQEIADWRRRIRRDADKDRVRVRIAAREWISGMVALAYVPDDASEDAVAEASARLTLAFGDPPFPRNQGELQHPEDVMQEGLW
jgi:hypothetical protein